VSVLGVCAGAGGGGAAVAAAPAAGGAAPAAGGAAPAAKKEEPSEEDEVRHTWRLAVVGAPGPAVSATVVNERSQTDYGVAPIMAPTLYAVLLPTVYFQSARQEFCWCHYVRISTYTH